MEFVRVCVEYVYVVGYSLGLGVVLGVGLEYESDSILGSLINRGACQLYSIARGSGCRRRLAVSRCNSDTLYMLDRGGAPVISALEM